MRNKYVKVQKFRNELILDEDKIRIWLNIRKIYIVRQALLLFEYVKINFDGSVKGEKAISGFILRNYFGRLLKVGVIELGKISVYVAEVTGFRNRIRKVFEIGYKMINNREIFGLLKGEIWSLQIIFVNDSEKLLSYYGIVNVNYILREGNIATDWIVNIGYYFTDDFE